MNNINNKNSTTFNHTHRKVPVAVSLSLRVLDMLNDKAKKYETTRSQLMRAIIEDFLGLSEFKESIK